MAKHVMTERYAQHIEYLLESKTYLQALSDGFRQFDLSKNESNDLIEIINRLLLFEIGLEEIEKELLQYLIRDKETIKKIQKNIFLYVLVFVQEFYPQDIAKEFTKISGNSESLKTNFDKYKLQFDEDIRLAAMRQLDDEIVIESYEKEYTLDSAKKILDEAIMVEDVKKEQQEYLELFKKRLQVVLDMEDKVSLAVINHRLIVTLDKSDQRFLNDLKRTFLTNSEKYTKDKILVNDKLVEPNIQNWLLDFKNFLQGDQVVSKLLIAQYIASNQNVSKLDKENKQRVAKLLDTYYMIDQLPKSLTDLPVDQWYIFPIEHTEVAISEVKDLQKSLAKKLEQTDSKSGNIIDKVKQVKEGDNFVNKPKPEKIIDSSSFKNSNAKKETTENLNKGDNTKPERKPVIIKKSDIVKNSKVEKENKSGLVKPNVENNTMDNKKMPAPVSDKKEEKVVSKNNLNEEQIRKKYLGDETENKLIIETINKVSKLTGQNPRQLLDILIKTLDEDNNKVKIVAILKILAETKNFDILITDERVKNRLNDYAKEMHFDGIINVAVKQNKKEFLIIYILKYILEYKVELSNDESARIGLQIANVNKRVGGSFVNLSRFNMQTGNFEWAL